MGLVIFPVRQPGRLAGGCFNLLLAGMALVLAASMRFFFTGMEGISVAARFLVAHEADSPDSGVQPGLFSLPRILAGVCCDLVFAHGLGFRFMGLSIFTA